MIVKILTGVFDPPPEHLSVPWAYLAALLVAVSAAIAHRRRGMLRASGVPRWRSSAICDPAEVGRQQRAPAVAGSRSRSTR